MRTRLKQMYCKSVSEELMIESDKGRGSRGVQLEHDLHFNEEVNVQNREIVLFANPRPRHARHSHPVIVLFSSLIVLVLFLGTDFIARARARRMPQVKSQPCILYAWQMLQIRLPSPPGRNIANASTFLSFIFMPFIKMKTDGRALGWVCT